MTAPRKQPDVDTHVRTAVERRHREAFAARRDLSDADGLYARLRLGLVEWATDGPDANGPADDAADTSASP